MGHARTKRKGGPELRPKTTIARSHADALDNLTFFARTRVVGSGWYGEGGGFTTVCNEATFMAAYAMADWLLQSHSTSTLAGAGLGGAPVKILELFRGAPDEVPLDGSAYDAAPAAIATGSFYRLAAEGGFLVSAVRERVATRLGPEAADTVYRARTVFVAVESTIGRANIRVPLCAARALNAAGQSRVTLSLR